MRLVDRLIRQQDPARHAGSFYIQAFADSDGPIPGGYQNLAKYGYELNSPVFSVIATRMLTLSEIRFGVRSDEQTDPNDDRLRHIKRPWKNGTEGELVARMDLDASLSGNSYWTLNPTGGLRRLRPDWVDVIYGGDDDEYSQLLGYAYHRGGRPSKRVETFLADQVAHYAPIPDGLKLFTGMSWLNPVVREGDLDSKMVNHQSRFFKNAGTANMVLKVERQFPDDETRERSLAQFRARHEGTANAWKTILLEGGADLQVIGHDFEKMTLTSLSAENANRIASAGGVPPVIVGFSKGLDSATYSNYGQAMRRYADITCRPLWRNQAGSLAKLVDLDADEDLWYVDRDIPFLQQDASDQAQVRQHDAGTLRQLIDGGFDPASAVEAVTAGDFSKLQHTGLVSVQLQPPGVEQPQENQE